MLEIDSDISKEKINSINNMFRLLKAEIEAFIRFSDTIKRPIYYFHVNNIVGILMSKYLKFDFYSINL